MYVIRIIYQSLGHFNTYHAQYARAWGVGRQEVYDVSFWQLLSLNTTIIQYYIVNLLSNEIIMFRIEGSFRMMLVVFFCEESYLEITLSA